MCGASGNLTRDSKQPNRVGGSPLCACLFLSALRLRSALTDAIYWQCTSVLYPENTSVEGPTVPTVSEAEKGSPELCFSIFNRHLGRLYLGRSGQISSPVDSEVILRNEALGKLSVALEELCGILQSPEL